MKNLAALIAALHLLLMPAMAAAQDLVGARTVTTETWVEEWDPASQRWVRVADDAIAPQPEMAPKMEVITSHYVNGVLVGQSQLSSSYSSPISSPQIQQTVAQYGPFRVLDGKRAAITGPTDQMSPRYFDAMLRDHPGLEVLEMIEAPGTSHDIANLAVGRRIREAGLRTHVPRGGSVRSGAVELFLAGVERTMDDSAQFAVHSWLDNYGREPGDFPADHPANRLYLDYYIEMGMSERDAQNFYAMTNSVPHASALWLGADQMRDWVPTAREHVFANRTIRPANIHVLRQEPEPLPVLDRPIELPIVDLVAPAIAYDDVGGMEIAPA